MMRLLLQSPTSGGYSTNPMGRMGEAPGGVLDYLLVAVAIIAVIISIALMVWWLFRPGEDAPDHIKRLILDDTPLPPQLPTVRSPAAR
jgi:hypothetical protein